MSEKPNLARLIDFQKLLLAFQAIDRGAPIPQIAQQENDVEHSYFLAMMAWYLAPHFPSLNRDMLIRLALVHDLLEVHSGDTFVYGQDESLATKKQREAEGMTKLTSEWADFPDLASHIHSYETKDSEEAKFIYALDKIMPTLLTYLDKGRLWKKHGVTFARLRAEKEGKITTDNPLWPYYLEIRDLLEQNLHLFA
jgi:putative hydrolase of HD superfamily